MLHWDSTNVLPALGPAEEIAECDKYAAPNGSDRARGNLSAPFRTAQRLVDSLRPGQTGCLRAGTYTEGDKVLLFEDGGTRERRIVLRAYSGEEATVRAQLKVPEGSNYTALW